MRPTAYERENRQNRHPQDPSCGRLCRGTSRSSDEGAASASGHGEDAARRPDAAWGAASPGRWRRVTPFLQSRGRSELGIPSCRTDGLLCIGAKPAVRAARGGDESKLGGGPRGRGRRGRPASQRREPTHGSRTLWLAGRRPRVPAGRVPRAGHHSEHGTPSTLTTAPSPPASRCGRAGIAAAAKGPASRGDSRPHGCVWLLLPGACPVARGSRGSGLQ